jgi:hypothetical protein
MDELAQMSIATLPDPELSRTQHIRIVRWSGSWMAENFDKTCPYNVEVTCRLLDPIIREGILERPLSWGVISMSYQKDKSSGVVRTDLVAGLGEAAKVAPPISAAAHKLMRDNGLSPEDVLSAQLSSDGIDKITVPMVKAVVESQSAGSSDDLSDPGAED